MATRLPILLLLWVATSFGRSFSHTSQRELRSLENNQQKTIQMNHLMQPKSIDLSQVIQLSRQPRVFQYRTFLSDAECDYLMSWGDTTSKDGRNKANLGISSYAGDEIASRIEERISA